MEGAVFAGLHRDGQVSHTALDALQRCFALHRHIFVESALTMDGIQLPHRGLNNASVLDMQLRGQMVCPNHLQPWGLSSVSDQVCSHAVMMRRPSGAKGGLGGVEVDAAVHQLHVFPLVKVWAASS